MKINGIIENVQKRDGRIVPFEFEKITFTVFPFINLDFKSTSLSTVEKHFSSKLLTKKLTFRKFNSKNAIYVAFRIVSSLS